MGLDSSGNLIPVELKKGKTPREVVAQILEYSAWGASLNYESLNVIAKDYYKNNKAFNNKDLQEIFAEVYMPDNDEPISVRFNTKQRLFIVAEEISPTIRQVCIYLREVYGVDINCIEYEILRTQQDDFIVSTSRVVGYGSAENQNDVGVRWKEPVRVKTVISDAIEKLTQGKDNITFTPSEVIRELVKQYPDINQSTVRCQIIQDCVNHTSRRHYPSGQRDLYYRIGKGKYRPYNPNKDGRWDWEGKKVND
ncbi:DUF7669 domain-containing protein [Desulfofalx alkaliphila]|uniref:DUF7669 domain-containing protein n=1 Tax=Desulfofalx alkaliphila TaxID=105483 RepID=UPI0004E14A6D|nr:hypothetical protein [Desulfofalx alkaliphila]